MDITLLVGIAIALFVVLVTLLFFQRRQKQSVPPTVKERNVPVRAQEGIPRRVQIVRNQRNRLRNTAGGSSAANLVHDDDDDDQTINERDDTRPAASVDEKMGAKKRAKLEAKAEKKAQREIELQSREEKKKKEALLEEERKKQDQKTEEEERKLAEAERMAREEKERKEHEEYLKLKEAFSVEEEGFEEGGDEESENLLQEFIEYIKTNKVVVLEELANNFKIKTQHAIDRIAELQKSGAITGVIDDRGTFIFISEQELDAMAKFIRQRGRVSISELAESSNKLINLMPVT